MEKKEFYSMIEEIIEAESETLTGQELLEELDNWDSLAIVNYIAVVDENFSVTLAAKKILECKTVDDLLANLNASVDS
jgi:acyl carrier protein